MRPLTTTAELADALAGPNPPIVLDVRWMLGGPPAAGLYAAGHLPGAVFIDLETDLTDPPGGAHGGRHPLPDVARFTGAMRRAGVSADRPVVVYDGGPGAVAARAWWLLRWAGHDAVTVLDGGFAAWAAAGLTVTTDTQDPAPGDFTARPGAMPVINADTAADPGGGGVLIDARAADRYQGLTEPVDPRAGHIPGAVNLPFPDLTDEDGHWLDPADLRARFAGAGVTGGVGVAAYCGSGVTATSIILGLELAGLTTPDRPAALYPGSWSEYSADPARPAATGPTP